MSATRDLAALIPLLGHQPISPIRWKNGLQRRPRTALLFRRPIFQGDLMISSALLFRNCSAAGYSEPAILVIAFATTSGSNAPRTALCDKTIPVHPVSRQQRPKPDH